MTSRSTVIGLIIVVILIFGAIVLINEANDGPLENAAEEVDDAAEEFVEEIEN